MPHLRQDCSRPEAPSVGVRPAEVGVPVRVCCDGQAGNKGVAVEEGLGEGEGERHVAQPGGESTWAQKCAACRTDTLMDVES